MNRAAAPGELSPSACDARRRLEQLAWDNSFARLPAGFHSKLTPDGLPEPYLVAFNPDAAALLGLDPDEARRPDFAEIFCGNTLLPGSEPLSALYAGHQFGTFVPQLGDGRAHLLGEVVGATGSGGGGPDARRWDLQLKGAGLTPYSRMGDGRAVLRSTIREYLCSEAMHGLGIPTTRSLAIVGSDQPVIRENVETAAVLTRVAPSHVRFGSFEVFFYRRQMDQVRTLADHLIDEHYQPLRSNPAPYVALLREIVRRTGVLVARWQAVGFCHGVMNTDNMSALGLTIDYGPFGFLDGFDAGHICNHTDEGGRYAYNQQPAVAHWNLTRLAQAMLPLMKQHEAEEALDSFATDFEAEYSALVRAKLGLATEEEEDAELLRGLFSLLQAGRTDYTLFFRRLCDFDSSPGALNAPLRDLFIDRTGFDAWAAAYRARLAREGSVDAVRSQAMRRVNPKYVLRNHLAEIAIRKAADERDWSEIERLRLLLSRPFDEQPEMAAYGDPPPDWAAGIEVSCSS